MYNWPPLLLIIKQKPRHYTVMPINLLPSEEKNKIKKDKSTVAPHIEMTGPATVEKKKPGVKQGGVLMFVKQAIARPKETEGEEQRQKPQKMPEKKIQLEDKLIYTTQKPRKVRPKIEYITPAAPEIVKKKKPGFGQRLKSAFTNMFGGKKSEKEKKPITIPTPAPQGVFPKYKSIHAEKIEFEPPRKTRRAEVITVKTHVDAKEEEVVPAPKQVPLRTHRVGEGFSTAEPQLKATRETVMPLSEEKKKRKSAWKRFVEWLNKLFAPKKKPKHAPEKPKVPQPPLPQRAPEQFYAQREISIPQKSIVPEEAPAVKKVESLPVRQAPEPLPVLFPPPPVREPVKKVEEPKPEPKPVVPPPAPPKPKPALVPKVQVPPPPVEKKIEPKKPKRPSKFSQWLKRLLRSIAGLFKGKNKNALVVPQPHAHEITKVKHTTIPEMPQQVKVSEPSVPAESDVPATEKPVIQPPQFIPPPPPPVARTEVKKSPKSFELQVSKNRSHGIELTQPAESFSRPARFDWDVNLVPTDVLEQVVPVSLILYLILAMILACGFVFGGWLAVNFIYNNNTIEVSKIDSEIASKEAEISAYDDLQKEVDALNTRVKDVRTLLDQHVYWSKFFTKLEQNTLPEVYYSSMSADVGGSVVLNAYAKTYEDAIKQLYIFERATDFVSVAVITGITFINIESEEMSSTESTVVVDLSVERPVVFKIELSVLPTIFQFSSR